MKEITKIKTKYYSKEILKYLLLAGVVCIAASSPYFAVNLLKNISKPQNKKKAVDSFNYLRRKGLLEIKREGHDARIALTKEGRKLAGKYQIDDIAIAKPKRWDKKWRLVVFDIPVSSRLIRDIFRRKLKEFGFYCLQQSIWISPYPCQSEIKLLREFFGLNNRQMQILEVAKLENESFFRKIFKM